MKAPKIKIKPFFTRLVIGISFILLAILILLSANVAGLQFLTIGVMASIGFTGFWVFVPLLIIIGLYIIFAKKLTKFKFDLSLIGLFIMIFGASILVTNILLTTVPLEVHPMYKSMVETEQIYLDMTRVTTENGELRKYLEMSTFIHYFLKVSENGFVISNSALGGGFIAFMIDGMLNSAITPVGTIIVSIVTIVIGICLVVNFYIRKLFKFIVSKINKAIHKKDKTPEIEQISEEPSPILIASPSEEKNEEEFLPFEPFESKEIKREDTQNNNIVKVDVTIERKEEPLFETSRGDNNPDEVSMVRNSFNNSHTLQKARFSFEGETFSDMEEVRHDEPSFKEAVPSFLNEEKHEEAVKDNYEEVEPLFNDEPIPSTIEVTKVTPKVESEPVIDETDISSRKPKKAKPLVNYVYPSTSLIDKRENESDKLANKDSNDARMEAINAIFQDLSIGARAISYTVGPSFTRFDIQMESSKSVSTVDRYIPDLASRLNGIPVRFQKLVIGKPTSGLEIGNDIRTVVGLKECLDALPPTDEKTRTYIPFGKDIDNKLIYADLTKFPHMLVAGSTGSGKSVFVHSVIATLILRNKPDELKLLLIDPKRVEMNVYHDIPHLLCPNISEANEANVALNKLVEEMERRYSLFASEFVNDIKDYNKIMVERGYEKLPYIVIFVDEYADLSESCKEIRTPVVRIAQKARAAGIHLVLATQRPSVNVIDGVIKANISTHVALSVNSYFDSNVILGEGGAEQLLGNGDMIVDCALISRQNKPRLQGAYCTLAEINRIANYLRDMMPPQYDPAFLDLKDHSSDNDSFDDAEPTRVDKDVSDDILYKTIVEDIVNREFCSISYLQRSYAIGFPRAGRMFGRLQKEGYVEKTGDARGNKVIKRVPINNEQQLGSIEQSTLQYVDDDE